MILVRRTDDGVKFTRTMIGMVIGLITIGTFLVTVTAAAVGARQQLVNSTPVARHDSLVEAVREIRLATDTLKANLLGLNCAQSHYPSPFCDGTPRVIQAGSKR